MPSSPAPSRSCPQCGQRLRRTRRLNTDLAPQQDADLRRYRCRASHCGWTGLLPRRARVAPSGAASQQRPGWPQRLRRRLQQGLWWLAGGAIACTVPAAVVVLMAVGHQADQAALQQVPPGVSHDGRPVAAALSVPLGAAAMHTAGDAAATAGADAMAEGPPLALREGCAWGQPGRLPYRGTTAQALRAARLPPEVVQEVTRRREARAITDRLEIRTGLIRTVSDGRTFNAQSFALTFGDTMCVGARVNFAPGHVERADLYEVRDARGRLHAVMVPDVCGNVSVLGARGEKVDKAALTIAQAALGGPVPWVSQLTDLTPRLPWLPGVRYALGLDGGGRRSGGGEPPGTKVALGAGDPRAVPEPGTLGVVALGLVALVVQRWLSRRSPSSRPCASSSSSGRRPSSSSSSPASARTGSAGG